MISPVSGDRVKWTCDPHSFLFDVLSSHLVPSRPLYARKYRYQPKLFEMTFGNRFNVLPLKHTAVNKLVILS